MGSGRDDGEGVCDTGLMGGVKTNFDRPQLYVATVPKRRRATEPTFGFVKRRLKEKKVRGEAKALRGKVKE